MVDVIGAGFGRTGTASLKAALEYMIDIPGFGLVKGSTCGGNP